MDRGMLSLPVAEPMKLVGVLGNRETLVDSKPSRQNSVVVVPQTGGLR